MPSRRRGDSDTRAADSRGLGRQYGSEGSVPVRAMVRRLRRKLGDDADNLTYILTKRRVGYRIEKGETWGQWEP